jgi:hypothetical protein
MVDVEIRWGLIVRQTCGNSDFAGCGTLMPFLAKSHHSRQETFELYIIQ